MADELIPGMNAQAIKGAADAATSIVYWVLGFAIVVGIIILIWYFMQFKHQVRVRVITKDRSFIVDDKARRISVDGVEFWQLLKRKDLIPIPPAESLAMNGAGQFCVEVFYNENGEYIYTHVNTQDIKGGEAAQIKKKGVYQFLADSPGVVKSFQPITTNQRQIFFSQMRKAFERRPKSWKETLMAALPIMAAVIIIVCLLIFYGEIAKPVIEMGQIQAAIAKDQKEMLTTLQEMIENKQIFVQGDTVANPSNPPPG